MTPQWAAVTTQSSLMREPPQKWKPVLSCRKMRRVSVPWTLPHRPGQWPPAQLSPQCLPLTHRTPLTCRDTCQGQEPGTASSPLTILARPLSTGWMAGTPQPGEGEEVLRPRAGLQKSSLLLQMPRPTQNPLPHSPLLLAPCGLKDAHTQPTNPRSPPWIQTEGHPA